MRRQGPVGTLIKVVLGITIVAVILAVLGIFQGDPFAVFSWLISRLWGLITQIRDWLLDLPAFRNIFN
jgi:hypothetical protein